METPITPAELRDKADISLSYAHMILSGERVPPLSTAVRIYKQTGRKFGILSQANADQLQTLVDLQGAAD